MSGPSAAFIAAFALCFYVVGATFVEGFVNYRTWPLIGAAEFKAYHRAVGPRVIAFVVVPIALLVVVTAGLLWWRPQTIPAWSVWVSLGFDVFAIAISLAFQIPIQRELDRNGFSLPLLRRLVAIEWFRKGPHIANSLLFLWMMSRLLSGASGV